MNEFFPVMYNLAPYIGSFILMYWIAPAMLGILIRTGLNVPHDEKIDHLAIDYFEYCRTVFQVIGVLILIIGMFDSMLFFG